jgi:predicted Rossmann fold flavoprotein
VIVATGGVSWPHTGSTGDGYEFARGLGHTIVELRACLVRLVTVERWCGELAGVGVKGVAITARVEGRRFRAAGPMLFTEDGIGGPAVFDLSRLITDLLPNTAEPIKITVDLMPEYDLAGLEAEIVSLCGSSPKKELAGVLARLLPRRLALRIAEQLRGPGAVWAGQLEKKQRKELLGLLKKLPLSVVATGPIAEATITRGGVPTDEIERTTMESKLCRGVFFAGEVMDVDGPCGGFNLQIAFSTGWLAGMMAAERAQGLKRPR